MKKFNFKLQSLLRLRSFKEDKVKVELGEIVSRINAINDEIKSLNHDIEDAYSAQRDCINGQVGVKILHFFGYYVNGKRLDIKKKEEMLVMLEEKYKKKTLELSLAMGDVKIMNNLKDRHYKNYKKDYDKKMQNDIDDVLRMKKEMEK